jgi:hypothetical protein
MHLSRPAPLKLTRHGYDYVGTLYLPKKDISGFMLLFRNSQQRQKIDSNKGQLYVIPVYDEGGRLAPHVLGGQASVFTRTHFLSESGIRPDPNRVVTLYEQELKAFPDLQPMYWLTTWRLRSNKRKRAMALKSKRGSNPTWLPARRQPCPS